MTSTLPRRFAAVFVTAALMTAGLPALAHAADHPHPRPPRAATPSERVAYVQRAFDTTSAVPQRTAAI
jgi:hypothetical protein